MRSSGLFSRSSRDFSAEAKSNPKYLEAAESLSQNLSLYAWLSYKFPQIFVDGEKVPELRLAISSYITRALLTQAGYGQTAREIDLNFKR